MLYMRGSSTDDSFMRNRLTYKGAKCCERTGRKSQYFTLISVVTGHCVCLCVFCHTNSKNFCFVYYYGSSSHRRTCRGLSVDAPPAPSPSLSLSPFPGSFSLFQGCLEEKHPPPMKGFWMCLQTSHTHRRQSAFRCDGRDVAVVGRGGCTHKTHMHYICRYTKQSQRTLSILTF